MKNNLDKILNQPSYWIEGINGVLYNAIIEFMEKNKFNRTQLAQNLGISKGRVSQILNNGEINFSIEKIVEISIKVGKYPVFELEDSQIYLNKLNQTKQLKSMRISNFNDYSTNLFEIGIDTKKTRSFETFNHLKIAV
ncbi:helix-turn-helix transcriptional regulator [Myroides marinus]|uniref:Helix-turn-helix n=1 Tax=Myroides marinus TaxID=703342 RepID=A0A1H6YIF9_9FLAO|nr:MULTISPECIES: helix-turn-helix transcriptional regulator [Myroides]MDM1346431.1 helix-turn-helix transcriptional regulator [Myroides marinus]MDM1349849.1 helix-turn-helix transcriptional regulator [Myroides marinus]MDM1357057.1 helix-turn-helix transcriptional regulator [Myroides marinus]MDM1361801.1 helix-turn-helix transcriptional regulator [Myroides marinus]MDM1366103.1 helix-turn-helix transcriptional regulator [Myroides marinus]